jgi:2-amino-4-hydroxy-6-hydroxymethyldihydropteridine diphosphokinase
MTRAFVGIGSNIEPERNIAKALISLAREARVVGVSTFYRTRPEGRPEQPDFYNGVAEIETDLPPVELKQTLRRIERELGRERTEDEYAPRTIDLDIALYDDLAIETDDLTIPDPRISKRAFLAIPLFELAPDLVLPGSGIALRDIAESFCEHGMQPLTAYTERLRKEVAHGL